MIELEALIPIVVFIVAFLLAYMILNYVYGFELTAEQKQDEALTQVCMLYHIDNKECFMVYGSIDNPYEPEK